MHRRLARPTVSPVAATTQFVAALAGVDVLATMAEKRTLVSALLDLEVTERGYLLLVAPLLGGSRPTSAEIAAHVRWWFEQLP